MRNGKPREPKARATKAFVPVDTGKKGRRWRGRSRGKKRIALKPVQEASPPNP